MGETWGHGSVRRPPSMKLVGHARLFRYQQGVSTVRPVVRWSSDQQEARSRRVGCIGKIRSRGAPRRPPPAKSVGLACTALRDRAARHSQLAGRARAARALWRRDARSTAKAKGKARATRARTRRNREASSGRRRGTKFAEWAPRSQRRRVALNRGEWCGGTRRTGQGVGRGKSNMSDVGQDRTRDRRDGT